MAKNKGYTLMELIIVIAIIGILTGASFVTIGMIRESKRQSAVNTLDNQIASCLVRTKSVSAATNGTDAPFCMMIAKRSDNAYAVLQGYMEGGAIKDVVDGHVLNENTDDDCEAVFPKDILNIVYDGAQQFSGDKMIIQFIKTDGSTRYGGGNYKVYVGAKGSGKLYATVYLDPVSGKHYVKFGG